MEALLIRLAKSDSREHQLRPIYDLFESQQNPQQPKQILLMPFADRVAGATTLWNQSSLGKEKGF